MIKIVQTDIIANLSETIDAIEKGDFNILKELSNHTIHCGCLYQDEDSISTAILIYALYKICTKHTLTINLQSIMHLLIKAQRYVKKNDVKGYRKIIERLFKIINQIDNQLMQHINELIENAKITKGIKLASHGISCAKVANLVGVSQWDLLDYFGKTKFSETTDDTKISERLKIVREIFP